MGEVPLYFLLRHSLSRGAYMEAALAVITVSVTCQVRTVYRFGVLCSLSSVYCFFENATLCLR